jgi:hypothetical protein
LAARAIHGGDEHPRDEFAGRRRLFTQGDIAAAYGQNIARRIRAVITNSERLYNGII